MQAWVPVIYGLAIPCFILSTVLYLLRICGLRQSKVDRASVFREVLVAFAFIFNVMIFANTLVLPIVKVHDDKAGEINYSWEHFATGIYIIGIYRSIQEDVIKLSFAITWNSLAIVNENKRYRRFVKGIMFCQVLYCLRILWYFIACRPIHLFWTTHFLRGAHISQCYDRRMGFDLGTAVVWLDDILLLLTPVPALRALPAGHSRRCAMAALCCLGVGSTITNALTFHSNYSLLIHEPDAILARHQLLYGFAYGIARPGLLLALPCIAPARHTLLAWKKAFRNGSPSLGNEEEGETDSSINDMNSVQKRQISTSTSTTSTTSTCTTSTSTTSTTGTSTVVERPDLAQALFG